MINLLKFNGELISNGLAAMSLDCKYSKLPGNMFFLLSIRSKHRGRRKKKRESKWKEKICPWQKFGSRNLCWHHGKHKALVAVRESLTLADSSRKLLHSNSMQYNSLLVHSVGYLRISDWACFTLLKYIFEAVNGVLYRKKTHSQTTNKTQPLLIGKFSSVFLWDTVWGLHMSVWSGRVSVCYWRAALHDESTRFRES